MLKSVGKVMKKANCRRYRDLQRLSIVAGRRQFIIKMKAQ
jgi:hypothetical protein